MAKVVLLVSMALSLTKTILVKDAVGARRLLTRSPSSLGSNGSSAAQRIQAGSSARSASGQQQQRQGPAAGTNAKVRNLHRWLLVMHVTATISLAAAAATYTLPVSDSMCFVATRIVGIMALLSDASLVLFLLAEVHLTNGHTRLNCLEKGAIWTSRLYAYLILPALAIYWAATTHVSANPEETYCFEHHEEEPSGEGHSRSSVSTGIAIKNILLIVQFVLLLCLFVKPMLALQGSTSLGGAGYRRVIIRSVICTISVAVAHVITTMVVVLALKGDSYEPDKAFQLRHIALGLRLFATLCLTEMRIELDRQTGVLRTPTHRMVENNHTNKQHAPQIALPLGFTSCITDCRRMCAEKRSQRQQVEDSTALAGAAHKSDGMFSAEEMSPQTP